MKRFWLSSLILSALSWGGMAEAALNLMQTRVIYQGGEATLLVRNDGTEPSLLQAWVDGGDEQQGPAEASSPFLVVPPMMRLGAARGQTLRILGSELERLPRDRESLFWLNVLGLPPKASTSQASVQLAYRTRIKLFYRPPGLQGSAAEAVTRLRWQTQGQGLSVSNRSPFHISLSEVLLEIGAGKARWQQGGLIPPYGMLKIPLQVVETTANKGRVRWIDDNGIYHEQGFVLGQQGGNAHE
ncbi:fimbrial biogenesis chaperone [Aeromonas lusitana]|uniref:Molecular chaperone n=1 Tax=Aeromonas lusitana TaxID=931529 RepID=A0A2M8H5K9_9GAMM|nr:molecular chaperone [Aeromonas lusitana]PJC91846.1 molecular chaperone [Aeromonas lusitana]